MTLGDDSNEEICFFVDDDAGGDDILPKKEGQCDEYICI